MAEQTIRRSQIKSGAVKKVVINDPTTGALSEMTYRDAADANWNLVDDGANQAFVTQKAIKDYIVANLVATQAGMEFQDSCIDILLAPPAIPAEGDRYLIAGVGTGDFAGKDNQIAAYKDGAWVFTVPTVGTILSVDDESNGLYYFNGTTWEIKYFGNQYIWGKGLIAAGQNVSLDLATDAGLEFTNASDLAQLKLKLKSTQFKTTADGLEFADVAGAKDQMWVWDAVLSVWVLRNITDGIGSMIIFNDKVTGLVNGINKVFVPVNGFAGPSEAVFVNGILQEKDTHYTRGVTDITFVDAPYVGDIITMMHVSNGTYA